VNTLDDTFADPQLRHRGMVAEMNGMRFPGPPIRLSETPAAIRTPPARFGQHTDEVLRELGLGDAEISALRADGVV
jgi:crotonobetainyl-CoA:carnitine CoA-transferase CaiB-like acyl-CoA transferase